MRKTIIITILVVLPPAMLVGAGAMYAWLARSQATSHSGETDEHGPACQEAGHAGGEDHDTHVAGRVRLTPEAVEQFGIEVVEASGGTLEQTLRLPAEIALNADRVAHIVPRVPGIIREIRKNVGDKVEAGELLAVMESRELAEARAADLSAEARLKLAENTFKRVEELVAQKISPQKEYYEALQKLEEAQIQHRETEAKLQALGVPHDQLTSAPAETGSGFSRYEIRAPFPATVVAKHATLGEVHDTRSDLFVLADLSTVWVDITIYPRDAARVRAGSKVRVTTAGPDGRAMKVEGTISYISPVLRESTRTGLARAVIPNNKQIWKPGLFVTAEIVLGQEDAAVLVPNEAIHTIENKPVLFVAEDGEFAKRPVVLGKSNDVHTQVLSGLRPGERYVAKGGFILKAEWSKGNGEHEH